MSRKATKADAKAHKPTNGTTDRKSGAGHRRRATKGGPAATPGKPATKAALVLAALRTTAGVSLTELGDATGWQAHSIRGFLSGTVRRKLGLDLRSELNEGVRRYRVVTGTGS